MTGFERRYLALAPEARGAATLVLATALFASMDAVGKGLMTRYDPFQVVWARYLGQALLVALAVSPRFMRVARTAHLRLQLVRSAMLFGATLCGFFAFAAMPLGEATAIFNVAPLMITAMAALILREQVGPRRWAGVACGFLGALIIIRPGSDAFQPAALLPLAGAVFFAGYSIATRFLSQDEDRMTTLLYSAALGALVASVFVPLVWVTPTWGDAGLMALMGLIGSFGQLMLIVAFNAAPASAIAPFTYAGIVFASLWGFLFFGDAPDVWTAAGAAVIAGSGIYVWRRERARRLA